MNALTAQALAARIHPLLPQRDLLGECPLWDVATQSLYWIDGRDQLVHRYWPADGRQQQWALHAHIGSIALCRSGRLLLALEDDFHFLDPDSGQITPMGVQVQHSGERMRLNDGRCDRGGRFVVGSMSMTPQSPTGKLYQLSGDGRLRELDQGFQVANATCFSPNGRWLYFADSPARQIWRYAYDPATGACGAREAFIDTAALGLAPDGATVDAQGYLWVAMVLNGQLARFTPNGELAATVDFPADAFITCPAFGGPALQTIYLTSISNSGNLLRSSHPDAGAVFVIDGLALTGLEEARFDDSQSPR
ncbi:SMP-30/gluconolactonase/LRE family protein [Comamonas koreensis]|uniref:SMP-30/gluconolactonase/LRE family protein n=1 Tax=Comamonas koreensis TaxID=160825 RepID=A0AAW4XVD7_9BURK|nr:SMP-30/gluconolactonase/LRE family protein [Comamonas koreensis]MCD2166107.1 SMP-30/gluconolactonase/LRE family protein [Comamonas koreensis]